MIRCFIGLGSNLEQPLQQVQRAIAELAELADSRLGMISPWYQSRAIGPGQQDDYINGVVELFTALDAHPLLQALHRIEASHGRERIVHWGPRTLDLDLLLYGDQRINDSLLTVPHPRMLERSFVLYPLYNIAPDLLLTDGTSLRSRLDYCPFEDLSIYQPQ
jgi:2-amino-4-hydroxy-6-hydroxymethyldihydropteridine diphosphokinase